MLSNNLSVNNTHEILFCLIRIGLGGKSEWSSGIGKVEWSEVIRLAAAQGVLAIAWDGLQKLIAEGKIPAEQQPSRDQTLRWLANVDSIEKSYARQKAAIRKLASFYNRNGFEMMLLKGFGLSLCYPIPEHRPCGDIDIWLYGFQQAADALLREKHGVKINEDKHHHTTFTVNGILVENHCHFLNINTHRSNVAFEQDLRWLVNLGPRRKIAMDDTVINLPPSDFNALFLLKHTAAHFVTAETALRHICDWAVFVNRYSDDIHWTYIYNTAKSHNLDRFLAIINRICSEQLGVNVDKFKGIISKDKELTDRVLMDIINPEFNEPQPNHNIIKIIAFRSRRWWAKRWKHRLVYKDSLVEIFVRRIFGYIMNPNSIWK